MIDIRLASTHADYDALAKMARELALYHDDDFSPSPQTLSDDSAWFSACIAWEEKTPIGYAAWYRAYSPESATRGIELHNLYIDKNYRQQKIGQQLLLVVAKEAFDHNAILTLGVKKGNDIALSFYQKLGFTMKDCNELWRARMDKNTLSAWMTLHTAQE